MECACIGNEYDGEGWDFEPTESYPVAKKIGAAGNVAASSLWGKSTSAIPANGMESLRLIAPVLIAAA